MKRRTSQVASNISRAAQEVLARGVNDPRVQGMVTVTGVDLTDDLKFATLKVTVLPEEKTKVTLHGLRSALPMIRKRVMERVHIKEFPQLRIVHDEGLRAQARVSALLGKAHAEEEARRESPGFQVRPADDAEGPQATDREPAT